MGTLHQTVEEDLVRLVTSCSDDPLKFVLMCFPWGEKGTELENEDGPDTWQRKVLTDIKDGLSPMQAVQESVASGHGVGKSALVSWIAIWAMATHEDTKGVVTANTEVQLKTKTWAELAKWKRLCLCGHWFEMTATSLFSSDPTHERTWRLDMVPWSEQRSEAFAGLHNKGKRVLLIFDEASAIADSIWEVSEGALTDSDTEIIWCVFGNPTKNTGRFRECFGKFAHRWRHYQVDSRTCKMTNKSQIQEWVDDWGEDSDFVRVRVRGEFPRAGSNQFIPSDDVARARKRQVTVDPSAPKILSLDVARFGSNRTVAALKQGRKITILSRWRGLGTDQTTERFIRLIDEHKPDGIVVDEDGIGGAIVDQLRARGYDKRFGRTILYGFRGGMTAYKEKEYMNRRAEIWDQLRQFLTGEVQIDDDPALEMELTGPEYYLDVKGRFALETKDSMANRGLESPDAGDAMALLFAITINTIRMLTHTGGIGESRPVGPRQSQRGYSGAWMR